MGEKLQDCMVTIIALSHIKYNLNISLSLFIWQKSVDLYVPLNKHFTSHKQAFMSFKEEVEVGYILLSYTCHKK